MRTDMEAVMFTLGWIFTVWVVYLALRLCLQYFLTTSPESTVKDDRYWTMDHWEDAEINDYVLITAGKFNGMIVRITGFVDADCRMAMVSIFFRPTHLANTPYLEGGDTTIELDNTTFRFISEGKAYDLKKMNPISEPT